MHCSDRVPYIGLLEIFFGRLTIGVSCWMIEAYLEFFFFFFNWLAGAVCEKPSNA